MHAHVWRSYGVGRARRFFLAVGRCLLGAALISLPVGAMSAEPVVIRFSHVTSETSPKGVGAQRFKELVEERLAGRVRVEVYPGASVFDDDEAIRALLFGDLEMAAPSLSKFRPVSRRLQLFDLPFLFDDMAHLKRFQRSPAGKELLNSMEDRGIKGLAYWDNGPRVVATKRPVALPGDLQGSFFRIEPSDVTAAQYRLLDVVPIPLPFSRAREAAITGLVDGQENTWSNIASIRLHEYLPHLIELDHSYLSYMLVVRASFWEELPEDVRGELEKIIAEVTAQVNRLAREKNAAARANILAGGSAKITTPDPQQRSAWKAAFAPVRGEFADMIGREFIEKATEAAAPTH